MRCKVSTKDFYYVKTSRMFLAEISSLPEDVLSTVEFPNIVGFTLVSETSGREIDFNLYSIQKDVENDVQFWYFVPSAKTCRKYPEAKCFTCKIFND